MAITRLATYSINQGLQKSETFLAGQENIGWYEAIASFYASTSNISSVTFSNIPQYYKHLQVRFVYSASVGERTIQLQFNSDTSTNYPVHDIYGNGASLAFDGYTSLSGSYIGWTTTSGTQVMVGSGVSDILDYTNITKFKVVKSLLGADNNGSGRIFLQSSAWQSTSAITNIIAKLNSGTYQPGATISLYGIRGA